jgi:hypothetical protein
MSSFSSLNSYAAQDVVMTVEDLFIQQNEGSNITMPLMAWTPIHDIGDPFNGNGVQITHTFHPGNIIMSDGTIYTPAQYANVVVDKPTTATTGNVWTTTSQTKFIAQSIAFNDPNDNTYQPQAAVIVNLTQSQYSIASDFCVEYWHYPVALSSNLIYPFVYTNLYGTAATPRLGLGYAISPSSPSRVWHRLVLDGGAYDVYIDNASSYLNTWHHFAIVRLNGNVRLFIDGALVTFGNTVSPPQSVSVIPNTTNYSHIADYIRLGSKDNATNWGYPDGSGNGRNGYLGQVRFSNVARYTTTSSITVPTAAWTNPDANTVFLVQAENGQIVDKANTYALNRVLEVPPISLRGGRPNVALYNPSTNVYQVKFIHDPEDYLAGDVYLDFPRDYSGVGNPDEPGKLSWTTNIKNLDVATYDFTYNVDLELINTQEVTNTDLADVPYDMYGNTLSDISNVITLFNDTTQTTQISDSENTDSPGYYVTITTEDHPYRIQLSTLSTAVTQDFYYANGVPGGFGQLTITGTKDDVNDALLQLKLVKNDFATTSNQDRPNARNVVGKNWSQVRNPSTGGVTETWSAPNIATQQTASPPVTGINYCVIPNNQDSAIGNSQALNVLIPNSGTSNTPFADNSWNDVGNPGPNATEELYLYIDDPTKNCNIIVGGLCSLSLYGGKLWMAFSEVIPGIGGTPDTVNNKPRRIEYNGTIAAGTWYHIAMTKNAEGGGVFKFYVNGQENSTVYTGANNTVAVANGANGFTGSMGSLRIGGHYPIITYNGVPWRLPGFAGRIAQIRLSRIVRYTANFTPPTRPFFNDAWTLYLHQFNTALATDDASLPPLATGRNQFTWKLGHVDGTPTVLSQDYYAQFTDPLYAALDVNYVVPSSGRYRVGYAGRDSANNPVFVYGFRDDSNGLTTKVDKLDVNTGNLIYGPNQQISTATPFNTVQVITNNEGVNLRETLITSDVPISITMTNSCLTGNVNLESGFITLTGNIGTGQASAVESVAYNFKGPNSVVFFGSATANATASVFDNRLQPTNLGTVVATNALIATELNMIAFPGLTQNRVLKLACGLQPPGAFSYRPQYNLTLVTNSTNPASGNFGAGAMMPSLTGNDPANKYKVRSIAINQDRVSTNYDADNRFLWCVRNRETLGTINESIYLFFRAGRCDDAAFPYMAFGPETSMFTGPSSPQTNPINVRVGGFDIVPGATKNKAWMIYNKEFTTSGGFGGVSNNTAAGLWYMGINISNSYVVTFDSPVQYIDPSVSGAIYRPSLTAQSTSIGSYTYIYAVVGSVASAQPYPVAIRIPN